MWLAAHTYLEFMQIEVWPRLSGQQPMNSFPFIRLSEQTLAIGCMWLAAVILFWSWRSTGKRKVDDA